MIPSIFGASALGWVLTLGFFGALVPAAIVASPFLFAVDATARAVVWIVDKAEGRE